jgi:glycosyltransferase involved in cell wall biosynthesis
MPRISVIIPVYNGEKTIRETVESVLNQTFSDFELIVINDGSQDSTLDILANIQDPRLKVFSQSHAGVSVSRNNGIVHAHGEFITFLDADDLWTPDKLETQLKALEANPQASVAYSWTDFIDESGRFLWSGLHIAANGDVLAKLLMVNFLEGGSNPLIRKQALTEVGDFDSSLEPAEDWEMWLRLATRYYFIAVPIPQILYRYTSYSASANISKLEAKGLKTIELAFARAPEALQHLKRYSLAKFYEYLISRAINGPPGRRKGLVATRFLWRSVKYDLSLLGQVRYMLSSLFKIAVTVLLPPQQASALLAKIRSLIKHLEAQEP